VFLDGSFVVVVVEGAAVAYAACRVDEDDGGEGGDMVGGGGFAGGVDEEWEGLADNAFEEAEVIEVLGVGDGGVDGEESDAVVVGVAVGEADDALGVVGGGGVMGGPEDQEDCFAFKRGEGDGLAVEVGESEGGGCSGLVALSFDGFEAEDADGEAEDEHYGPQAELRIPS